MGKEGGLEEYKRVSEWLWRKSRSRDKTLRESSKKEKRKEKV